jgi:hypothetical protein
MTKERWCYLPLWVLLTISLTLVSSCQPATVGWVANPSRWEPFSQGLPSYALTLAVATDPAQPGVLYVGTYHPPGLWRSDDDGETWVRDGKGLENQPVFILHWDPVRSRWWAGAGDGLYCSQPSAEPSVRPSPGPHWSVISGLGRSRPFLFSRWQKLESIADGAA